ncbi:MAG: B12-binding domain-containing radical SAM protein [Candidatus Helarchaeota archaeon]|nr:B12-binding domain-containing radical SAM protein [Candidatus Helarchaeota archaeon]
MRILFVVPKPWKFYFNIEEKLPPIGLAYLSAILKKRGDIVKIFDNYLFEKKNVEPIINRFKPDIVGISITSITARHGYEVAKIASNKGIITILGGPHATLMPRQAISKEYVDYVVVGEGELTIKNLMEQIENGKNEKIKGVFYKDQTYIPQDLIKNLDSLPFPAWELVNLKNYPRKSRFVNVSPVDSLNTSRGCPFNCVFCSVASVWGRNHRSFSPERIIQEILILKEKYQTKAIYFREDNFTANRKRVENFCKLMIDRKIDMSWICESRVDTLNKELLIKMKKSGCQAIYFGIESGSQKMLNYMKKGINLEQAKKILKLCKSIGIKSATSFLIGTPEETYQTVRKTVRFIIDNKPDYNWVNIYTPLPKSNLYNEILDTGWYEKYDVISGMCHLKTPKFDFNIVNSWLEKAWKEEYTIIKYWLSKLKKFNLISLKNYIQRKFFKKLK